MDQALVDIFNDTVHVGDTTFFLGDVAMGKLDRSLDLVGQMNGRKILIPGNHDRVFPYADTRDGVSRSTLAASYKYHDQYMQVFDDIVYDHGFTFTLPSGLVCDISHFPYLGDDTDLRHTAARLDELDSTGRALICGHVHEKWKTKMGPNDVKPMVNIGVDQWDFAPVSATQVDLVLQAALDQ